MAHILLITTSYPQSQDGSEAAGAFVADFALALSQKIKVTVLAPAKINEHHTLSDNYFVQYFQVPSLPLSLLKPYNPVYWPAIVKTLHAGTTAVKKIISQQKFDHVLALWALPSGYWAQQAPGIPYSTWALGSDIWTLSKIPIVKQLLQKILRNSHSNFADGYKLAEQVKYLSSRSCEFLPSTREIKPPSIKKLNDNGPYKLGYLGRWHPNKGTDLLMESLSQLNDEDWSKICEVRIAGGGPLAHEMQTSVTKLQLESRPVTLQGFLNKSEATELLSWADYLLIPSRIESIPVIFSDAMKCLTPVVAMPVGDLPLLLNKHKAGELADEVSSPAFARAIKDILNNSPASYINELHHAGKVFNLDECVNKLLIKLNISTDS